jgi:hypothetical protein
MVKKKTGNGAPAAPTSDIRRPGRPKPVLVVDPRRCTAKTTAGKPCGAFRMNGRDTCALHTAMVDPELQAKIIEARSRGGKTRAEQERAGRQPTPGCR